MTFFVGAISAQSPYNWQKCKDVGLFGITTHGRKTNSSFINAGDKLLIWMGQAGWVACVSITDKARPPLNKEETPWGGGMHRFGLVFPIEIDFETEKPVWAPFKDGKQEITGMSMFAIRKGFSQIPDEVGNKILKHMQSNLKGLQKPSAHEVRMAKLAAKNSIGR